MILLFWWISLLAGLVGCCAALGAMGTPAAMLFGLTVGASTATLVWLLSHRRHVRADLAPLWFLSPAVLYAVGHYAFFVVATVAALVAGTFDPDLAAEYYGLSALLQMLGLWAFVAGCHLGLPGRCPVAALGSGRPAGSEAVLWAVAVVALGLAGFMWLHLIVTGAYFSKAPATSFEGWGVALAFRWIFCELGACAPVLAVLVLAQIVRGRLEEQTPWRSARWFWIATALALTLLVVGSAQVRQGLFMIGLTVACLPVIGLEVRRWHAVALGAAVVAAFGVMILLRAQSAEIAATGGPDRFWYIWQDAVPRSVDALLSPAEVVAREKGAVGHRVKNAPDFLTRVIAAHSRGRPLMLGDASRYLIEAYIPRAFWPDKPFVNLAQYDPESRIQRHFLGTVEDTAINALVHLYAEGGAIGLVVGMFLLGWLTTRIYVFLLSAERRIRWGMPVYAPFVAAIPMSEGFTAFHVVGILRLSFVVYVLYKVLEVFFGERALGRREFRPAVRPGPYQGSWS